MFDHLKAFKAVMDKIKVTFWLDAGTLLFVVRDNKLDPSDIDVGIYQEDYDRFTSNLDKFPFKVKQHFKHPSGLSGEVKFQIGDTTLDVFAKPKRDGRRWWLSYVGEPERISKYIPHHVPSHHFDKLDLIKFQGTAFNIPSFAEDYLALTYGDWQTPDPSWRWDIDPKCIDYSWEIR